MTGEGNEKKPGKVFDLGDGKKPDIVPSSIASPSLGGGVDDESLSKLPREEAAARTYESRRTENAREFSHQQCVNYALVIATMIASIVSVVTYYRAREIDLLVYRPYLVLRTIEHSKSDAKTVSRLGKDDTELYTFYIKNAGNLPARVSDIHIVCEPSGVFHAELNRIGTGVIGNGEEGLYMLVGKPNKETQCTLVISYHLATAATSTLPFETKYELYLDPYLTVILPGQVWMK